jgi:signal transduction histidine kinase
MAVFRIFQEMLSNVVRHAQASRVVIRIAVEEGLLALSVQDDGRGAPAQAFEAADRLRRDGHARAGPPFRGAMEIHSHIGAAAAWHVVQPDFACP